MTNIATIFVADTALINIFCFSCFCQESFFRIPETLLLLHILLLLIFARINFR